MAPGVVLSGQSPLTRPCNRHHWWRSDAHYTFTVFASRVLLVGGNTFRLLDRVRSHGFIDAVRAFVADGGAYTAAARERSWPPTRSSSPGLRRRRHRPTDLSAVGLV